MRLALGYTGVVIAAATFYFDYYYDWSQTKYLTAWAVGVYFVINTALTGWIWFVERGKVFEGSREGSSVCIPAICAVNGR